MTLSEISEKTKTPLKFAIAIGSMIITIALWAKVLEANFENHERLDDARVHELKTRVDTIEKVTYSIDSKFEYIKGKLETLERRKQ